MIIIGDCSHTVHERGVASRLLLQHSTMKKQSLLCILWTFYDKLIVISNDFHEMLSSLIMFNRMNVLSDFSALCGITSLLYGKGYVSYGCTLTSFFAYFTFFFFFPLQITLNFNTILWPYPPLPTRRTFLMLLS